MDFQCKSRRLFFSYRKLRLLYEKALRAKDAQLRARNTTKCPLGKAVLPKLLIAECAKHTFVLTYAMGKRPGSFYLWKIFENVISAVRV